jgi:hypothetical protein
MRFGSSMSVFNATFTVEDHKKAKENADKIEKRKQDFDREEKFLKETKPKLKKLQDLEKSGKVEHRDIVDLSNLCTKRTTSRSNLRGGIKELKKWGVVVTSTELDD